MATQKQALGRWGEDAAARYLQERGYEIVARNVRTAYGELDLVARKAGELVFVEVKARSTGRFGPPETAVTAAKQEHLVAAAESYLQANAIQGNWRIDVIAVRRQLGAEPELVHFENALSG
jgi:putative endonuclease